MPGRLRAIRLATVRNHDRFAPCGVGCSSWKSRHTLSIGKADSARMPGVTADDVLVHHRVIEREQ